VRGVPSEVLHDVALIVAGGAADGVEGGGRRDEVDGSTRHLGWFAGRCSCRCDVVLALGVQGPCASTGIVVVGCCVEGRQFDCCR
jgi:hypothetical protein